VVNGCKPDVSHLVDGLQPLHDHLTDLIGADLPIQGVLDALLDLCGDPIQICHSHLPLVKGADHGVENFIPVEALMGAIPLNHDHRQAFHHLIGGKPTLTIQTLTAAADAAAILRMAGIHHFTFLVCTKRTLHRSLNSLRSFPDFGSAYSICHYIIPKWKATV
jgi:hypothetical protein